MDKPRIRVNQNNEITYVSDSYRNIMANIGSPRDKASGGEYIARALGDIELLNSYRGSWLARKIVDIIADDATRQWRSWNADTKDVTLIEDEEKRLMLKEKVRAALRSARLYGIAAIHFVLDGDSPDTLELPVEPERLGRGAIQHLTVIPKSRIAFEETEDDPVSPFYGLPKFVRINSSANQSEAVRIHVSRMMIFHGQSIPEGGYISNHTLRGDSALQSVYDAIIKADATAANIASLVFEAKIDVIRIPGLMVNQRDPEYEARIIKRFGLAATAKSNNGTLILDKEEEYASKGATFASLPDVMDRFFQNVAGAADIPMTRLYGMSPAGLNATGESDLKNYYDRVKIMQELEIDPAMTVFNRCLVISALGNTDEKIWHEWRALWQMSDKERHDLGKIIADIASVLSKSGIITPEAVSEATANALIEYNILPGLEEAIEEYGAIPPEPTAEELALMMGTGGGGMAGPRRDERIDPRRTRDPGGRFAAGAGGLKRATLGARDAEIEDAEFSDVPKIPADEEIGKGRMRKLTNFQKEFWRSQAELQGFDPEEIDFAKQISDYDPDQPRDDRGRWTRTGAGASGAATGAASGRSYAPSSEADYQAAARAAKASRGDQGLSVDIATGADAYFVADNGFSAFAMRGNDVIGVASHKNNPQKGVAGAVFERATEYAIQKGYDHLTLDCFEPLTQVYSKYGFKETGRVKFDWQYAPPGWRPEHGEPDVVFMRRDIQ